VGDHFGGPPESMREIAWAGLVAVVVLLLWAQEFRMKILTPGMTES
jgi:hypothetical protein